MAVPQNPSKYCRPFVFFSTEPQNPSQHAVFQNNFHHSCSQNPSQHSSPTESSQYVSLSLPSPKTTIHNPQYRWPSKSFSTWQSLSVLNHSVVSGSIRPMDGSPPDSSAHGIFQARLLEWVAISFSRSSQPRDQTSETSQYGSTLDPSQCCSHSKNVLNTEVPQNHLSKAAPKILLNTEALRIPPKRTAPKILFSTACHPNTSQQSSSWEFSISQSLRILPQTAGIQIILRRRI